MNHKEPDKPPDNMGEKESHPSTIEEEEKSLSTKDMQDIEELMKDVPPPIRTMFLGMMRESWGRSPQNPLYSKITSEHIDKLLDYSHKGDENAFTLSKSNRYFHLFYTVFFSIILILLIFGLLPSHKDVLYDILKILVGIAGGFGAGYGLKSYIDKKK